MHAGYPSSSNIADRERIAKTKRTRFALGHLQSGGGSNAGYTLTDVTVHDDHAADVLTGESGNDWFLFNKDGDGGVKDKATDLSAFETQFATDIDWLMNGI